MNSKKSHRTINILSSETVAKIAAGEVVERPASVVKELIENSIDAGSTQIHVVIRKSGLELIEVSDNGSGMSREDASLAFEQHTTSKIKNDGDLKNIITLGFRGEALSSIAAVADIELNTNNGQEQTKVNIENQIKKTDNTVTEAGTTIKVKNLFKRVPARKKFLRSETTEFKHISDIFIQHALAQPQIHFKLTHNNKEIYNLPQANDLKTRIFDIWGNRIADKLFNVFFDGPTLKIQGMVGLPEIVRKDRSMQYILLNNRPIRSELIAKSVNDAFHATKAASFQPIFFINLSANPQSIDVNVHPRKLEAKFSNTQEIFISVKRATQSALEQILQKNVKQIFDNKITSPSFVREPMTNYVKPQTAQSAIHPRSKNLVSKSMDFSKELLQPSLIQKEFQTTDLRSAQFFNTFIIVEKDDKLLFIDQHAADERINYEAIMNLIEKQQKIPVQALLVPDVIELSPAEYELIKANLSLFTQAGLELEPFGNKTLKINAIPNILDNFKFEAFIREILEREVLDFDNTEILHQIVASMACHGSIRAGKVLQPLEIRQMINQLFECKKPYSCPHGRPIMWEMSKYEIEKKFKRTGFC